MTLGIDPGPEKSAWILLKDREVVRKGMSDIYDMRCHFTAFSADVVAIEMIASYGMPVGREVFETCVNIGRIIEICSPTFVQLVYRKDIKIHLCGSMKAKDSNIRQALIDRVGPQGKKASPGPTYGLAKHDWSALAIAIYAQDKYVASLLQQVHI